MRIEYIWLYACGLFLFNTIIIEIEYGLYLVMKLVILRRLVVVVVVISQCLSVWFSIYKNEKESL